MDINPNIESFTCMYQLLQAAQQRLVIEERKIMSHQCTPKTGMEPTKHSLLSGSKNALTHEILWTQEKGINVNCLMRNFDPYEHRSEG